VRYWHDKERNRWEAHVMAPTEGEANDRWLLAYLWEVEPGLWACQPCRLAVSAWGAVYEEIRALDMHEACMRWVDGYVCTFSSTKKKGGRR
jgi:hypothetical protein